MKKHIFHLLIALILLSVLCGCSSEKSRVEEALNKLKSQDSFCLNVDMSATADAENLGTTEVKLHYDINTEAGTGSAIAMWMNMGNVQFNLDEEIRMDIYIIGDKVYVHCPQITDQYIDHTSIYPQIASEVLGMDMAALDFDIDSAKLNYSESTITYQDKETDVLMVGVVLNDVQLTELIQTLARQSFSSDTLLVGSSEAAEIYETLEVESGEYILYLDDEDNILSFFVHAVFSLDVSGQDVRYDMGIRYDIVATGDEVTVELPDIRPEDTISYEALQEYTAG